MAEASKTTETKNADAKPAEQATAAPGERRSAPVGSKLAPAAESSDPAVHQLLAEIQTAQMNDDKDAESAARKELRQLGYE